jgi:hypothetical protein
LELAFEQLDGVLLRSVAPSISIRATFTPSADRKNNSLPPFAQRAKPPPRSTPATLG